LHLFIFADRRKTNFTRSQYEHLICETL